MKKISILIVSENPIKVFRQKFNRWGLQDINHIPPEQFFDTLNEFRQSQLIIIEICTSNYHKKLDLFESYHTDSKSPLVYILPSGTEIKEYQNLEIEKPTLLTIDFDEIQFEKAYQAALLKKKAQLKVVHEKRKYNSIFYSINDAILIIDANNGQIIDANPSAEYLFNQSCNLITREKCDDLFKIGGNRETTINFLVEQIDQSWPVHKEITLANDISKFIEMSVVYLSPGNQSVIQVTITDMTERTDAEQELRDRIKFERFITNLSTNLISVPAKDIESVIVNALKQIADYLNMESSQILVLSHRLTKITDIYSWYRKPVLLSKSVFNKIISKTMPWLFGAFKCSNVINIDNIDKLKSIAPGEFECFSKAGIKAFIWIPMITGTTLLGYLGFASSREYHWSEDTIRLLRLFSETFCNALERKRSDLIVQKSERRLSVAISASGSAIYEYSVTSQKMTYMSERWAEILGYNFLKIRIFEQLDSWLDKYIHSEDRDIFFQSIQDLASGDIITKSFECRMLSRSGEWYSIQIYAKAVDFNKSGTPTKIIGTGLNITKRKLADNILKESVSRYRNLVETSPEMIAIWDQVKLVYINPAGVKMLGGSTSRELIGVSIESFIHPKNKSALFDRFDKVQNQSISYNTLIEETLIRLDQKEIIVESVNVPVVNRGQVVIQMMCKDITIRKVSEEKLKTAYRQFATVLNSFETMVYVTTWDTYDILFTNSYMEQLYGNVFGKTCWKILKNNQKGACQHCEQIPFDTQFSFNSPLNNWEYYNTESKTWYHVLCRPIQWVDGSKVRLVITTDITRRKIIESALTESEQKFRRFFDSAGIGMSICNTTGDYLKVNQSLCDMLGYSENALLGMNAIDLTHDSDQAVFHMQIQETLSGKKQTFQLENRMIDINDQTIWVILTQTLITDSEGNALNYIAQIQNITPRKGAEEQLTLAKSEAEEANLAKSYFLATMSHEIRTPMNGVIGMANLLKETELTAIQEKYNDSVLISAENLLMIINDILDFSKIEAGKLILEFEVFNLKKCIEDTLDLFATKASEQKINLFYNITNSVPDTIKGDIFRLRQILVNLISNALKFTQNGEIVIHVDKIGDEKDYTIFKFSVTDSGSGIPGNLIERIFDKFSQIDPTKYRNQKGTGLGLSICKKLCNLMGGEISVESELDIGSIFTFTIQSEKTQPPAISESKINLKEKHLLILTKSIQEGRALSSMMSSTNIHIAIKDPEVTDIEQYIKQHKYDIILICENQEGLDPEVLITQIDTFSELPILLISFVTSRKIFNQQIQQLDKPVKHNQLINELYQAFGILKSSSDSSNLIRKEKTQSLSELYPMKILIAEDNEINRLLMIKSLEGLGYNPSFVKNGKEVLDILEIQQFDLIFMDIEMPIMDGMKATRIINNIYKDTKPIIVAVTANALPHERKSYFDAGIDDYLSKPLLPPTLKAIISQYGEKKADSTIQETQPSNALIDAKVVHETQKLGKPFIEEIIDKFQVIALENIAIIKNYISICDYDSLLSISHRFKGMCANLGAVKMREICIQIESSASLQNNKALTGHVDELNLLYSETIHELKQTYNI